MGNGRTGMTHERVVLRCAVRFPIYRIQLPLLYLGGSAPFMLQEKKEGSNNLSVKLTCVGGRSARLFYKLRAEYVCGVHSSWRWRSVVASRGQRDDDNSANYSAAIGARVDFRNRKILSVGKSMNVSPTYPRGDHVIALVCPLLLNRVSPVTPLQWGEAAMKEYKCFELLVNERGRTIKDMKREEKLCFSTTSGHHLPR